VVTERHLFVRNSSKNGLRPFLFNKFYKFRRKSPFIFNNLHGYRGHMGTENGHMGTENGHMGTIASIDDRQNVILICPYDKDHASCR
jgi:hypothetical protein